MSAACGDSGNLLLDESNFHLDLDQLNSVGRMGAADYVRTFNRFTIRHHHDHSPSGADGNVLAAPAKPNGA